MIFLILNQRLNWFGFLAERAKVSSIYTVKDIAIFFQT